MRHGARPSTSETSPAAGVSVTGYRDLQPIGRGASSVVFRAEQTAVGRMVALKVLEPSQARQAQRRFERERSSIARLGSHPAIVQIFDAGLTDQGCPYVAMELYDESAADRLVRLGSFPAAEAVDVAARIAGAVGFAHESGILHRDIKPENVLLSSLNVGLADFGIARASDPLAHTQTLEMSPLHAAPEVFEVDHTPAEAADIWSLGSLLYTLLAGRAPFEPTGPESVVAYARRLETAVLLRIPRADLPPGVWEAIDRALQRDPAQRWPSAFDMAAALGSATTGTGGSRPPAPAAPERRAPAVPIVGSTTIDVARPAPAGAGHPAADEGWVPYAPRPVPATAPVNGATYHRAPPTVPDDDTRRRPGHRPLRWVVGGAALVALVVTAILVLGRPPASHPLPARLPAAPPAPAAGVGPANLTVADQGAQATLRWDDASQGADRYIVAYRPTTGVTQTVSVPNGQDHLTVTGLDPSTGYCFRVIGVSAAANGALAQAHADTSIRGCSLAPAS
jgi:serine/threonine-protein kinase PknK